ncbi:hypothetical protein [Flavobacterium sp. 25HG05S-40]|uniref:hypothetical protein n=1 Tax=Flavobacterium sp. 25HG05S-40 TaxID=3458682 RepID=UPI0040445ECB
MKKLIFGFIATTMFSLSSFANTPTTENKTDLQKENQTITIKNENNEDRDICTITCSKTVGGVTYTTSAGGWLTSCNTAGNQCLRKLGELTANLEP